MPTKTPRGIPIPEPSDPDDVPYAIGALAHFLDPDAPATSDRIVFRKEGNGDPNANGVPAGVGSEYLDRDTGRLWVPMAMTIGDTYGYFWYMLGAEHDQAVKALTEAQAPMVTADTHSGIQLRFGMQTVTAGGAQGTLVPAFNFYFTFDSPFPNGCLAVTPVVADATVNGSPTVLGLTGVSKTGFQVLFQHSDKSGFVGATDKVSVSYIAVGY